MKYWWVNQNQTYKTEVGDGFLGSPKTRTDGAGNQFYENTQEVTTGDVVFSYCDTKIKAARIATQRATSASKPEFGTAGSGWSNEGWLVPVSGLTQLCTYYDYWSRHFAIIRSIEPFILNVCSLIVNHP